jgi:hypothetical protein
MTGRSRILFLSLLVLLCLSCAAGCTSVRTSDTHNTTGAVLSYNNWASQQQSFNRNVQGSIAEIGDHISTYNREIASDQPDFALLRSDIATDRELLDQWGSGLDSLTAATARFEESTTKFTYGNASAVKTKATLGMITQYMKIYTTDMGNARQHLIEYVNDEEIYIGTDDPDYWNDQYRQDAMKAKDQAFAALADADVASGNVTAQAKNLENLQ